MRLRGERRISLDIRFRGVIFDLDGTLLDTIGDLARSMNIVLERFGFPGHDVETYKSFVGDGLEMLVRRSMPETVRDDGGLRSRCIQAMREEYHRRRKETTAPYPGIPELLDALAARQIKMAVLSNKPDAPTRLLVEELLPRWRFDAVVGESPKTPRKPDPAGALAIARSLGLEPQHFLFLGDTGIDMRTATAAGMHPVGALWGFRAAGELLAAGARDLIHDPREILPLVS
jgi:phosphoglycolate phosphatase